MNQELTKHAGDAAAVTVTVGTLVDYLPAVAAVFTIVWTAIRIYETATIQALVKKLRR